MLMSKISISRAESEVWEYQGEPEGAHLEHRGFLKMFPGQKPISLPLQGRLKCLQDRWEWAELAVGMWKAQYTIYKNLSSVLPHPPVFKGAYFLG